MRNNSPSLAPSAPAFNSATTYIVLDDFGPNLGRVYVETDEAHADQKTVVENMIAGQYSILSAWSHLTQMKAGRAMCPRI